jgi:acyl carrier protein
MATEITKEEINAVFPTVAETMADALGCDVEDIKLDVSLIEGLDAESIDFLDMVFRLERAFKIKIPRGKIIDNARGSLSEAEFEQKGVCHRRGMAQLRSYLSEMPADRFADADEGQGHSAAVHAGDVLQARGAGAARSQGGRLKAAGVAWRRTDRPFRRVLVCRPDHGVRRRAGAHAALPRAGRIGRRFRRASWRRRSASSRPGSRWSTSAIAGGRSRRWPARRASCGAVAPGDTLELAVEIDDVDDEAVSYRGWADVAGRRVIELNDCLGPMLPVADFDAPEALRERFALLRGAGAPPDRFHGVAAPRRRRRRRARSRAIGARQPRRPGVRAVLRRPFPAPARCFRRRCCSTRRSRWRTRSRAKRMRTLVARIRS